MSGLGEHQNVYKTQFQESANNLKENIKDVYLSGEMIGEATIGESETETTFFKALCCI